MSVPATIPPIEPESSPPAAPVLSVVRQEAAAHAALEARYAKALLKLDKGLGPKSMELAKEFADSGLPSGVAALLMRTVYAPTDVQGRGQSVRLKWFMETVKRRYSDRLDKARSNMAYLRTLLAELEEITQMKETLCGEGLRFSFEQTFHLFELGYDADSIMALTSDMEGSRLRAAGRVWRAAKAVEAGKAPSVEAALDFGA
jgi:hypothetical protein